MNLNDMPWMEAAKILEKGTRMRASKIWTTLYYAEYGSCYHVQWGSKNGPLIKRSTITKLSRRFLKMHREEIGNIPALSSINRIDPLSADELGY